MTNLLASATFCSFPPCCPESSVAWLDQTEQLNAAIGICHVAFLLPLMRPAHRQPASPPFKSFGSRQMRLPYRLYDSVCRISWLL